MKISIRYSLINCLIQLLNSIDLDQEIEKLVLDGVSTDTPIMYGPEGPVEGHRAPIAELFSKQHKRDINTQTPSSIISDAESSSSSESYPQHRCSSDDNRCPSSENSRPDLPSSPLQSITGMVMIRDEISNFNSIK